MPPIGGPKLQCHSVVGVHTSEDVSEVVLFGGEQYDERFANTTVYTFGMSKLNPLMVVGTLKHLQLNKSMKN